MRVAAGARQRCKLDLRGMVEGSAALELGEAGLEPVTNLAKATGGEERVEGLDVRVDRQDADAVRPEEPGEHRDREIRRGRVARGRVNERYVDAHGHARVARGWPSAPGTMRTPRNYGKI